MSEETPKTKEQIAEEVLGLGEALFAAVLEEARQARPSAADYPQTELEEASQEFFRALRRLLQLQAG